MLAYNHMINNLIKTFLTEKVYLKRMTFLEKKKIH